jgi:hypothetical protein
LVWNLQLDLLEEVTFNITSSAVANAAEIPENINFKLVSKDQFITSTPLVAGLKIAETKAFDLIAGPTPNLFI